MYLCLPLHLLFCSTQDTVGIAQLHVAAPVGIRGFSIRLLCLHASGSMKESQPGCSIDIEAAIVLGLLSRWVQCWIEQQGLW